MAVSKKTIQRRIKSVRNTRKITKAMELVAAAKMRRATSAVVMTRPFARLAWEAVRALLAKGESIEHPLLITNPQAERTLMVVFTSDRGLAGGYNVNMIKLAVAKIRSLPEGSVDVIAIGKRGSDALTRLNIPVIASFVGLSNTPKFADILPIARMITERFMAGEYKEVLLGMTEFISGISQKPKIDRLLPLNPEEGQGEVKETELTFEPNPRAVLDRMLPRLVETQMYQALLEAAASEHAARMMAMRNATDSATEMLESLTFTYNQARQAAITQEIAELVGGAAALQK